MIPPFCCDEQDFGALWQCNECGVLVLYGDELCGPCARREIEDEMNEMLSDRNAGCWSYYW